MLNSSWADFDSADILRHILRLYGYSVSDVVERSAALGPQFALGRNFISNVRRSRTIPRQTHLRGLAKVLNLTIGGAYRIFQIELDQLRDIERQLNSSRTRLIESYSFYRNRKIDVPLAYAPMLSLDPSADRTESIASWQRVPIRAMEGAVWGSEEFQYAQIGIDDDTAHPAIPRGATVQAVPVDPTEARHPGLDHHYLIQYGHGYLCTRCSAEHGLLHVLSSGGFYQGRRHFGLDLESRIFARAVAYFSPLPLPPIQPSATERHGPPAPIVLPWEHSSQQQLVSAERMRSGRTSKEFDELGEQARSLLGFGVKGRFAEEIEDSPHIPNAHSILALSIMCSLRFQDVLRSGGMSVDDPMHLPLDTVLAAHVPDDLPRSFNEVLAPLPSETWTMLQSVWRPYSALLSACSPALMDKHARWFYPHQSEYYRGMDALIPSGSIVLLRPLSAQQASRPIPEDNRRDWERPIYLVRIANRLFCSYLYADRNILTLVPHPSAGGASAYTIDRSKAQIVALVTGIFAVLP
jgi:hypothetical protein